MSNPWFKFYGSEFLSDPKMAALKPVERSCWITLLCLANTASDAGVIEFLTVEVLLNKSGIQFDPYHPEEWEASLGILKKLERMKMITLSDDGKITVINWHKRQDSQLSNSERQSRFRDKNKNSNGARYESNARVEESREDMKTSSKFSPSGGNTPQDDVSSNDDKQSMQVVETDDDGNEMTHDSWGRPLKQQKGPKPEGKNKVALRIQKKFNDMCHTQMDVRPVLDIAGYKMCLYAMNSGGLTEEQIYDLFDEWFKLGKPDEEVISITRALSARQIEGYKVRNNVK